MTIFQIVDTDTEGNLTSQYFETDYPAAVFDLRGFRVRPEPAPPQHLRPELRDHPRIEGLLGPMWGGERDGKPVIRYETADAYRLLSA